MKIEDALTGVQRLYIETAPLISYVEEHPIYSARMDLIIHAIDTSFLKAYSSVITLTEVLNQPMKRGHTLLEQAYRDILINSGSYQLVDITVPIAETAAGLRAMYGLRTPDALHVAAALQSRCDAFLTNDMGIKRITELRIIILDDLEP